MALSLAARAPNLACLSGSCQVSCHFYHFGYITTSRWTGIILQCEFRELSHHRMSAGNQETCVWLFDEVQKLLGVHMNKDMPILRSLLHTYPLHISLLHTSLIHTEKIPEVLGVMPWTGGADFVLPSGEASAASAGGVHV